MRTIYIDDEFRCHVTNDGTMTPIETDFFGDKCDEFIEGYRFIPEGKKWKRPDGIILNGEMITPYKPYRNLEDAQREHEILLLEKYKTAFAILGDL